MDLTCGTRYFSAAPFFLAPGKNRAERRHCSAGRSTPPRTTSFQIRRAQASLTAPAPSPTSPHRAPATTRPESCRPPPAIVAATEPSSSSSSRGQPAPATLRPNQHTGLNQGDPLLRFRPFPHGNHRRTDWTAERHCSRRGASSHLAVALFRCGHHTTMLLPAARAGAGAKQAPFSAPAPAVAVLGFVPRRRAGAPRTTRKRPANDGTPARRRRR